MAFSWSSSGQSVLRINIRQLCLLGVWRLSESWVFHAHTLFVFALGIWNFVEGAMAVYFTWGNLEETTGILSNSLTTGSGVVKMVLFIRGRQQIDSLAQLVDALVSQQRQACVKDPVRRGILQSATKRASRLTTGMLTFMVWQAFLWFPMPLITHPGERLLPFVQHPWSNNSQYALSYVAQCSGAFSMVLTSFGIDCLLASIMVLLAAELKILALRLSKLGNDDGDLKDKKIWNLQASKLQTQDRDYGSLCLCIETHQNILRLIGHLQTVMDPFAMTQFFFSVLVACVALFQATYSTEFSSVFEMVAFLPVPGGQVYLYCWAAHNIAEQAEEVSTAAYQSSWIDAGSKFKRALRILLCRTQKRLILTAGHIYSIDRAAFLSLVNATYSYYALLGQMHKQ